MSAENIIAIVRGAIHTGNRDFVALAAFVEREMRNLREETIEECAAVCDSCSTAFPTEESDHEYGATRAYRNAARRLRRLKHPHAAGCADGREPV